MRLGVISDVHADASALARALTVLERRGAVRVVCLGDVVEKGDEGDRVVDMLRANAVITVRGNHDEGAVRAHREEGDTSLRRDSVAWLEGLPATRAYRWETERVLLAHGAPHKVDEYVFAEKVPKRFKKALRGLEQDLLLLGHTHTPMALRLGALWVVNPGSVAGTRARDSHSCAMVELPGCAPSFYDLVDGGEIEVRPVGDDAAEAEPE